MFGYKRNTRKAVQQAPVAQITVQDGAVADSWGIPDTAWLKLTDEARRDYRDRVAYAVAGA